APAGPLILAVNAIARNSWFVADDRAPALRQPVEQRGFAHIRTPHDGHHGQFFRAGTGWYNGSAVRRQCLSPVWVKRPARSRMYSMGDGRRCSERHRCAVSMTRRTRGDRPDQSFNILLRPGDAVRPTLSISKPCTADVERCFLIQTLVKAKRRGFALPSLLLL